MGEATAIEWCDHTFNPWWGCQRVSPGCEHCYAETFSKRVGLKVWGPQSERRFFGEKHWSEPLKWDRAAERDGVRRRVFCASMADVFEDLPILDDWRAKLWRLIEQTPHLDWLLLTKRPESMQRLAPFRWAKGWPKNVWAGTTAEDQKRAEERLVELEQVPAAIRFVSNEPGLSLVVLARWLFSGRIQWVIVGGESGAGARPFDISWARSALAECREAGVACFVKQLGAVPHDSSRSLVGGWAPGDPEPETRIRLKSRKGDDMAEWPADLRVREFPRGAA